MNKLDELLLEQLLEEQLEELEELDDEQQVMA